MPIQYGAPSQYPRLSADFQQIMRLIAQQNQLTAQRKDQAAQAIGSGITSAAGSISNALNTGIMAKYRQQVADKEKLDDVWRPFGFKNADEGIQAAAKAGQSPNDFLGTLQAKQALPMLKARAGQQVLEEAFKQSLQPTILNEQQQTGFDMMPESDRRDFEALRLDEKNILDDISGDNPGAWPEQVIGVKRRIRARMAPYFAKMEALAPNAVTDQQRVEKAIGGKVPDGFIMAWDHKAQAPKVLFNPHEHDKQTPAVQFDYKAAFQRHLAANQADVGNELAKVSPAVIEKKAHEATMAEMQAFNQKYIDAMAPLQPDGTRLSIDHNGRVTPVVNPTDAIKQKAEEAEIERRVKHQTARATLAANLSKVEVGVQIDQAGNQKKVFRTPEEVQRLVDAYLPPLDAAPGPVSTQPAPAASQPSPTEQALRGALSDLLDKIEAFDRQPLKDPAAIERYRQWQADAQAIVGQLRGG